MPGRALIVDDHPVVRDAIVSSLISLEVFEEVHLASSFSQLVEKLESDSNYQLLILDLSLSDISGSDGLVRVREDYPTLPVIIFSASDSVDVVTECFEHGVNGFVSKNSSMKIFVNAIRLVLAGGIYIPASVAKLIGIKSNEVEVEVDEAATAEKDVTFTPKQRAVFDQLMQGATNKVISRRLNLAEGTVKSHLHSIYQLLGVKNRAQAILKAQQLQLSG